jgi:hypothetical protein
LFLALTMLQTTPYDGQMILLTDQYTQNEKMFQVIKSLGNECHRVLLLHLPCTDQHHLDSNLQNPIPSSDTQAYSLYGTTIPRQGIFSYLDIPINLDGYLNTVQLIQDNVNKALQTMNQMTTIGVNNKGFDRLLSVVFEDTFSFSSSLLSLFSLLNSKRFSVSFIFPFDLT